MATEILYDAGDALTITVASLADGGYRCGLAVDNGTDKFIDGALSGSLRVGTVTADGSFSIYGYGSADDGAKYSGGLNGADESITWGTTPSSSSVEGYKNLTLLGTFAVDTTDDDNDIEFYIGSVAAAFGGQLPEDWGIVVLNETGVSLHATQTNTSFDFKGTKYESV